MLFSSFVSRSKTHKVYKQQNVYQHLKFAPANILVDNVLDKTEYFCDNWPRQDHTFILLGTPFLSSVQCQFAENISGVQLP